MCHITYIPHEKYPEDEEIDVFLDRTFLYNGDGCGVSFFDKTNGKPQLYKSLDSINKVIDVIRDRHSMSGFLFHTRIASIGSVSINNCHPFYIGDKQFICHNGTMMSIKTFGDESDTRRLAIIMKNMKDTHTASKVLIYHINRERYFGNTFVIQTDKKVMLYNYYRFCKANTINGSELWTSSDIGWLESEIVEEGIHKIFPEQNVKFRKHRRTHNSFYSHSTNTKQYDNTSSVYQAENDYCHERYGYNGMVCQSEYDYFKRRYGV